MTDEELITRLRDPNTSSEVATSRHLAADRIEELQADVAGWIANAYAASGWASEAEYKLEVAEAKLAKAVKALRSYVSKEKGVWNTADAVLAELEKTK